MGALFTTVALTNTATVLANTAGTLIAVETGLAAWSGLPSAAGVLGTACGALLAGRLTTRRGRRFALLTGYSAATAGTLIAALGGIFGLLAILLIGQAMLGLGNGAAQLSRYLAADLYPDSRKGFALSSVIWAGTIGALTGPLLIAPTAHVAAVLGLPELSGPILFATLAVGCAALASFLLPADDITVSTVQRKALPWRAIRLPVTAMVAAQVTMVAVMTMTPPQLHHLGHGLDVVGWILSAHIIGMFALAPLSGRFADRFGGRLTIACGIVVLAISTALSVALPESHTTGLPISLFLLGYGWNLMFVGGSSLLSRVLPAGSQGSIDAVVWGSSVLGSIGGGQLFGWGGYSLVAAAAGVLAILPVFVLARRDEFRRSEPSNPA